MAESTARREAFAHLVAESLASQTAAAEADVASIRAELAQLSRRLVALERRLPARARRLEELRALSARGPAAEAALERVLRVPGIRGVAVEPGVLQAYTEPVEIAWEGTTYRLGSYRLVLDLAGAVRVESVDRLGPRSHWDHPHVQDGLPCLGNLREGVLKLLAEYEIALAVQVLRDFLSCYQPDTAYTPIEGWPVAPA